MSSKPNAEPPERPEKEDLPLIFLYTGRRSAIEGTTRFQKLVFLAQQETDFDDGFDFVPAQYGPYSSGLATVLEHHVKDGSIDVREERVFGKRRYVYSITNKGIQRIQSLLNDASRPTFDSIHGVKEEYNEIDLPRLLRIVYNRYEEYTSESELSLDALADPDAGYYDEEQVEPREEMAELPEFVTDASHREVNDPFVNRYLDEITHLDGIESVHIDFPADDLVEIVTVIARRDYALMDQLYAIEQELLESIDRSSYTFRIGLAQGRTPPVSSGGRTIHLRS